MTATEIALRLMQGNPERRFIAACEEIMSAQFRAERAEAEVKALRAALEAVLDNDCYHPENLPEGDERCRRARAALAGVKG